MSQDQTFPPNPPAMGRLTTHVLDTSIGRPADGVRIELHALDGGAALGLATTGVDGRCPAPLLEGARFAQGQYVLTFHLADYFRARGVSLPEPAFLERAVVHIGIAAPAEHYHVPLLLNPFGYSTYRGS